MKRWIEASAVVCFVALLTGCSNHGALKPNQISYKGKILTYGETDIDDVFFDDGINLEINKDNKVRSISVTSVDVTTYNNIAVGDKTEKVRAKYKHEVEMSDQIIMVLFDRTNEVDPTAKDKQADEIWLTYFSEDEIIKKIQIYDVNFGASMK